MANVVAEPCIGTRGPMTSTPTLLSALEDVVARRGDAPAFRSGDGTESWTWNDVARDARRIAGGLRRLGIGPGDTVGLLVGNRPEFFIADLGTVMAGGVPVSIYGTSSPGQVDHVLRDAEARVLIAEDAQLRRLRDVLSDVRGLELVRLGGEAPPDGTTAWGDLLDAPPLDRAPRADPEDLLTIIYTSGTTGPPKGVELTHRNVMAATAATRDVNDLRAGDRVISWLPMAHIAERKASYYAAVLCGLEVTTCRDARAVLQTLPAVRPNWFFAVPRIWEKLRVAGDGLPRDAVLEHLGLDQLRAANVGSAPCAPEILDWFRERGVPLTEVYGMTENAACCTSTRPGDPRTGVVGHAMPGVEIALAEDGEVLTRSPAVMRGYRGRPAETTAVLSEDGWLRTGDIGVLSDDGCLAIVDRKKDLIISSAGKNMSPTTIEAAIKRGSPVIAEVCVVGDGRPFNVAVIALDPDAAAGLEPEAVAEEVGRAVDAGNARLSRAEEVKRFVVADAPWSPGTAELTPTMKVRRQAVRALYADVIEALYSG